MVNAGVFFRREEPLKIIEVSVTNNPERFVFDCALLMTERGGIPTMAVPLEHRLLDGDIHFRVPISPTSERLGSRVIKLSFSD